MWGVLKGNNGGKYRDIFGGVYLKFRMKYFVHICIWKMNEIFFTWDKKKDVITYKIMFTQVYGQKPAYLLKSTLFKYKIENLGS